MIYYDLKKSKDGLFLLFISLIFSDGELENNCINYNSFYKYLILTN